MPKPYQQPYPPLYHAATTRETFTNIGTLGLSLLVGVATMTLAEILAVITDYQAAWQAAGHPGQGDVWLRLPIYVAACMNQARSEPQESVVRYYKRVRQAYLHQSTTFENAARASRAAQLMNLTYDDLLHTRVVFGTPEHVTAQLSTLRQEGGLSGIIMEPNLGGHIPPALVFRSMRLFAQEVAPYFR